MLFDNVNIGKKFTRSGLSEMVRRLVTATCDRLKIPEMITKWSRRDHYSARKPHGLDMPKMALATPRIPTIIAVGGGEDSLLSSVAIVNSRNAKAIISGQYQAGMNKNCLSTGENCPYPLATGSGTDNCVH